MQPKGSSHLPGAQPERKKTAPEGGQGAMEEIRACASDTPDIVTVADAAVARGNPSPAAQME
jgi:hypothetical protein